MDEDRRESQKKIWSRVKKMKPKQDKCLVDTVRRSLFLQSISDIQVVKPTQYQEFVDMFKTLKEAEEAEVEKKIKEENRKKRSKELRMRRKEEIRKKRDKEIQVRMEKIRAETRKSYMSRPSFLMTKIEELRAKNNATKEE